MKLNDLIESLQDLQTRYGDVSVRVAYQPNYPLVGSLDTVTLIENEGGGSKRDEPVIWFAVGSAPYEENPYAPSEAWNGDVVAATYTVIDGDGNPRGDYDSLEQARAAVAYDALKDWSIFRGADEIVESAHSEE